MKTITKIFNSFTELESFISSSPRLKENQKKDSTKISERTDNDYFEFSGTSDYSQAAEFLRSGYTYGCESLQKEMTGLAKNYKNVVTVKNDVFGVVPNIGAYMTGHPKNMINIKTEKKAVKTKVINMIVNTNVSHRYSTDDVLKVGAATLLQLIRLERNGYKVNLYVSNKTLNDDNDTILYVILKIKNSNEKLNLLKVAYPIVHPSYQRRHMFAVRERIIDVRKGYGYSRGFEESDLPVGMHKENTIIINFCDAVRKYDLSQYLKEAIGKVIK